MPESKVDDSSVNQTPSAPVASDLNRQWLQIRRPVGPVGSFIAGVICVLLCLATWWLLTSASNPEARIINPATLPSPAETWDTMQSLWGERRLAENTWVTLRRVATGFLLATVVGVPLGVLAGCFPPVASFLSPLVIFGRNIPIAALVPLTYFFFGIDERQKVMFIFLACVAFIIADTANSIRNVGQSYIDTAYTLGAGRRQVIMKVLVPLALPGIFDSLRLLFGLAFGYIMLAETIKLGGEVGGLGNLIWMSQRQGPRAHIFLIILIIPLVALVIDQVLFWVQRQLFPFRYGGPGWLLRIVDGFLHLWENLKSRIYRPTPPFDRVVAEYEAEAAKGLRPKYQERPENLGDWRP